eukprot:TRINITY_DN8841_c0_g1_i1.p2 TRINITY_DN8841_c0_g1~~TRINITY_DN8841_c0_g1_i1.p2  ORF type:complete len:106 (+),score=1.82 TRINITY_DN8841_c0_g1_i1:80-397(+)
MAALLDRAHMQTFQIAKVFDESKKRINAIDFNGKGELLVTSSNDEAVQLYNVQDAAYRTKCARTLLKLILLPLQASKDGLLQEVWMQPSSVHTLGRCSNSCVHQN